jgi:hypothetical protein
MSSKQCLCCTLLRQAYGCSAGSMSPANRYNITHAPSNCLHHPCGQPSYVEPSPHDTTHPTLQCHWCGTIARTQTIATALHFDGMCCCNPKPRNSRGQTWVQCNSFTAAIHPERCIIDGNHTHTAGYTAAMGQQQHACCVQLPLLQDGSTCSILQN